MTYPLVSLSYTRAGPILNSSFGFDEFFRKTMKLGVCGGGVNLGGVRGRE